jgi:hypothetical protein
MKKQIKELRIKIDGLSQLVKELKPFEIEKFTLDVEPSINRGPFLITIPNQDSTSLFEYKIHAICRTDRGVFRIGCNNEEEIKNFNIDQNSKEINKAYDNLILAKVWLGKILGELGEDTPYKNDGNRKNIEDIEPVADVVVNGCSPFYNYENATHIEKVDWLREEIKEIIEDIKVLSYKISGSLNRSRDMILSNNNVYQHLSEARFWLGWELSRIKQENNNKNE